MRNPEKVRVLLVDDHLLVRQGLRKVLEADPRIEVVGEVGDGEEAIEAAFRLRPTASRRPAASCGAWGTSRC
jgi:DNA-binding NarL/FixJ family response regulator